ncbi:MAG: hypothetical protein HYX68_21680 [Planctomycetes bacterium]|nr:hypothetical protein [Planctomycetota bacterium]
MATILMGWELGDGLGHVQRLARIARLLAEHGHQPIFALANVADPWTVIKKDGFPVLQAPFWNRWQSHGKPFLAASLADVLAIRGWGSIDTLFPLVEAWRRLLEYVKPDLIVTDYGPTLCLAAYEWIPVVQVGNWFPMPPVHLPTFPLLVAGQAPIMPQEEVLANVQEVQRRRSRPVPTTLTSILAAGDRFPTFFTELDPYQAERIEPIWDPVEPVAPLAEGNPSPRFFAYLNAENPKVEAYLTQMALTGYPGTAYVRGAQADVKERLRLQGLTILDEPARMNDMLAQATVFVHHAGSTANAAFAAGRPQLLFPQHLEQATTARILARLGVAAFNLTGAAPEAAGRSLTQVMTEPRFASQAVALARRLHERPRRPALPAILECSLARLR